MTTRELTTREAAEDLRIPHKHVAKLIRQGHLKARRKYPKNKGFSHWLIPEQSLAEYRARLTDAA